MNEDKDENSDGTVKGKVEEGNFFDTSLPNGINQFKKTDSTNLNQDQNFGQYQINRLYQNLGQADQNSLLTTLERLLAIDAIEVRPALTQASNLVAQALNADKVDIFLYDETSDELVAMGISQTPTGSKQQEMGLDRLAINDGGRTVLVYQNRQSFMTGHAEEDPEELVGVVEGLGLHSVMAVPLYVKGVLRGVVQVDARTNEAFSIYDLHFLEAVSDWINIIVHRAELTEKAIQNTKDEVQRFTAAELITIIAHDFRNYFEPINGWIGLLRDSAVKENRQRDLDNLRNLGNVIQQLNRKVEDLLDVNRLERGPFSLDKRPMELVTLVKTVIASFNSSLNPVRLQAPALVYLKADGPRLRQALENLLANALNHSPEGAAVEIRIQTEREEKETGSKEWVNLSVTDKGRGIEPTFLPQIFDRFAKQPGSSGLGLGLYLVQEIAHAHNGIVKVKSVQGSGTTFTLHLPL